MVLPLTPNPELSLYLIAGEPSGDVLGARLMAALKARVPGIVFSGIGGERMAEQGLRPLFPMRDIALMGFAEIVPHLPRLLRRIARTVAHIREVRPDAVVTIDAPGFNFRVAKGLRGAGIPLIHYVAPSVWAYKPGRAKKVAALYDHLLCLLPFEPPYFEAEGLPATCVGHPVVENAPTGDGAAFRVRHGLGDVPVVLMLPGSRAGELGRHLPLFGEVAGRLAAAVPQARIVMPVLADAVERVRAAVRDWPLTPVVVDAAERADAFAAGSVALAKSGTVTLELALVGVPTVVTYRVHPFSAWLMRRWLRTPYVSLVNILLNTPVMPELLQERAQPQALADEVLRLLQDPVAADGQRAAFREALVLLGAGGEHTPSARAAEAVLRVVTG